MKEIDCIDQQKRGRKEIIMRPSSLGGGRILPRTLSVCLSVCPSVPLSSLPSVTWRHLANYNDTRAEGRISYGHLGRTNLLFFITPKGNTTITNAAYNQ